MTTYPHLPVLLKEVVAAFSGCSLPFFIDGTLGAGGHAEAILKEHPDIDCFLGIDQDTSALEIARQRLSPYASKLCLKHGNFESFNSFIQEENLPRPNGIFVDLGVSSMQLDRAERGFSFMQDGPLDMRMNQSSSLTAADLVNHSTEAQLEGIFKNYGEEKQARAAARAIVKARIENPITTTKQLVNLLFPVLMRHAKKGIHPLTLVFQGLRIAVNRELEVLGQFMSQAIESLLPGGILAVISFHSLEDRLVKQAMRLAADDKWDTSGLGGLFRDKIPAVELVTKKPIEASDEECLINPRSRCAKLRVIKKK